MNLHYNSHTYDKMLLQRHCKTYRIEDSQSRRRYRSQFSEIATDKCVKLPQVKPLKILRSNQLNSRLKRLSTYQRNVMKSRPIKNL